MGPTWAERGPGGPCCTDNAGIHNPTHQGAFTNSHFKIDPTTRIATQSLNWRKMETKARPTPHGRRRVYVYIRLTMGNKYGPSKPNTLGPTPSSRSEDREVNTATPRSRSQEREAKTKRTAPGTQDEEVTTTGQEPVVETPDLRGRSRDRDIKTATQRWSPRPRRYDREPNLPRPMARRQDHDQYRD
jgi:hypothetical protein